MSSNSATAKDEALDQITSLANTHDITLDEIGAYLTNHELNTKNSKWITRLLGYLGAAFIFTGLGIFTAMHWDELNSPARVIISYGPGIIAFIMGVLVLKDKHYEKASTPLFLKSAILLPTGMFVFLHEYADGDDTQLAAMIVFGILALQFLTVFWATNKTTLLFFGYLFWNVSIGILMERNGIDGNLFGIVLGISIMSFAWSIDRTPHRAIAAPYYFLGSIGLLWSAFDFLEGLEYWDILYLPLTVFLMMISSKMQSRTLLLTSTFALFGFLIYFTNEYLKDVIAWPILLIIIGFLLIGISAYALKLEQKIRK